MKLDDLFCVVNGIPASKLQVRSKKENDSDIPLIRPSSTQRRTIGGGWVHRHAVKEKYIWPRETLFVSTNGEGSHSYSYVSDFEFIPGGAIAILVPKRGMNLSEKLFYAQCITLNRFKFSYGRRPTGQRLKSIDLPEKAPDWCQEYAIQKMSQPTFSTPDLDFSAVSKKMFKMSDLFAIERGNSGNLKDFFPGNIPYVGASAQKNGVTKYLDGTPDYAGGKITVSNDGSVGEAFFQSDPFFASSAVFILSPKNFILTKEIALFLCTLIRQEKFKYSYGRKWNMDLMKTTEIPLPERNGCVDWIFISDYMNQLCSYKSLAQP